MCDRPTNEESGQDSPTPHREPVRIRAVYDEIATHFSKTRVNPWPEVEAFLDSVAGSDADRVGLDIGCGNGRHTAVLSEVVSRVVALDASRALLGETRQRMADEGWDAHLVQGDAGSLPLTTGSVDLAVYVATLHHLPDRAARVRSLDELGRVLADGGRALVSAWSTAHDRFDADPDADEGFDTTVDWTLPGGETVPRFYHIYAPAEFEADLRDARLTIDDVYVSSGNCYAKVHL
ncbi:SAM-dependent methyltransferase [Halobacteriales archaeon QH_2_65_14]|nr:MAG: SAM-dependent methyltransferase [Halobacteriales archaeon QH_2_65_14]